MSWRPGQEGTPLEKQCKHDCKLCALNCAYQQALDHAKSWGIQIKDMGWLAQRMSGGSFQWENIFHHRQELGELPIRHGH